jgi:hypothetical protein
MCVNFDLPGQSFTVLRGGCGESGRVPVEGPIRPEPGVRLITASFSPGGTTGGGLTFYPRGTATPGSVAIGRDGSTRVDILFVEGLTGRVSRR